jgi:predicted O-methyltransferase YrrM
LSTLAHFQEVAASPYYRRRPIEAIQYGYSKWLFSKNRVEDPIRFLELQGIDTRDVLGAFEPWRGMLENTIKQVQEAAVDKDGLEPRASTGPWWREQGLQGGVSFEDGLVLFALTRGLQPEVVIETGVAAGVSSSFIGAALIENGHGHLYSIELEKPKDLQLDGAVFSWHKRGVGWAIPAEIRDGIGNRRTLILDDVKQALPLLIRELPHVDMFFHDDLHVPDQMHWEYRLIWPHLRSGGVLVSDDANYGWIRFVRELQIEPRALTNLQRLTIARKH